MMCMCDKQLFAAQAEMCEGGTLSIGRVKCIGSEEDRLDL
jgi:hypothetical protein